MIDDGSFDPSNGRDLRRRHHKADRLARRRKLTASVMPVTLKIGTHLWMHWLQTGCVAKRAAVEARARCTELGTAGEGFSDAFTAELQSSMVAISAAAFAIDALYGEIRMMIPVPESLRALWSANRTARDERIYER